MTLREMADVRCSCWNNLNHFKIVDRLDRTLPAEMGRLWGRPTLCRRLYRFGHKDRGYFRPLLTSAPAAFKLRQMQWAFGASAVLAVCAGLVAFSSYEKRRLPACPASSAEARPFQFDRLPSLPRPSDAAGRAGRCVPTPRVGAIFVTLPSNFFVLSADALHICRLVDTGSCPTSPSSHLGLYAHDASCRPSRPAAVPARARRSRPAWR